MKKINNCSNGGGYFRRTVNKKIIVPLIGIITLIILVVGISYAAFNYTKQGEIVNTITTGTITMVYTEGENGITLNNAIPTSDEEGKRLSGTNNEFDFTVQINIIGKTTISYEVTAEKDDSSTLEDNAIRIYLEKSTESGNNYQAVEGPSYYTPLTNTDGFGATTKEMVLDTGIADKTVTYYYKLRMWVAGTYQLTGEEKTFKVKVNVYGSDGVKVVSKYTKDFGEDNSNANNPQLVGDMIPVVWDETNNRWVKSPITQKNYYNYDKQIWANAVTIKDQDKRAKYVSSPIGTEIKMEDINTMWVWIPRYSYALKGEFGTQLNGGSTPSQATPGAFDIKFVDTTTTDKGTGKYDDVITEADYYTPSSFCWGDTCDDENQRSNSGNKELPGIWISKFEITGNINNIESKPNETSITNQTNQAFFNAIQTQMNKENGSTNYGFNGNNYDTHMIKNTEWGAMAYLSQSKYGKYGNSNYSNVNKEIYINNYSGLITGCSGGSPSASQSNSCEHQYYEETAGTGASTTGTIYGIYDTSGGAWERAMGNYNNEVGSSGFSPMPDAKYYNKYTGTTGIKGDATNADGTAEFYGDYQRFVSSTSPWSTHGGCYNDAVVAGIFASSYNPGVTHPKDGSRLIISAWQ